ncbi:FHA domain-containing protein [Coprococcus hominis (ex Arizal et al. 2022)]|jgi:pSer/pThr/pTyr-binding forkhead associated (FHA) protein|uniref:FHA domain-containing protein n=1 Tax=Coprococcus hominis (ex Arizal et al. 2022) TaxID=2881262 RepID=UPI000E4E102C|nr:FHA domain-containing protein [Clostridium sp. OM08-29]
MKSIVIYYGNQKSESYNLEQFQKEVVSFGRQPDNDIVLDLEFVSRIHGVFYMEEGIWYVQDLNSTNGILVNGNRVEQYAIEEGDCICIQGKDSEESISIYIGGGKEAKGNKTKSKKKLVIILSVVCVLLAGLIVSLIVYAKHRDSSKKDTATPTDASTEAEAETESEEPTTASTTEAETTTEEAEEIPEDIGFSYGKLQHTTFIFSSGAGAWETDLSIDADGNFSGMFHDSEMGDTGEGYPSGSIYFSEFSGRFGQLEKVDDYTYATTIESIEYVNEPGTEEIKDEMRYMYSEAYGLENAGRILFYLPGRPLDSFSEEERSWMNLYLMNNYGGKLPMVLLCNENEEQVMQGNSSLTAEYQPYIDVLEREADKISAYTEYGASGYGYASVCYMDVTGDEQPELIFMTENPETGGGDLNIYTIRAGREEQICFLENLDIFVEGGTRYCVFKKRGDGQLYAIAETYGGYGSISVFYRFDEGDNGELNPVKVMEWNDSGEVNSYMEGGPYDVVCTIGETEVSSEEFMEQVDAFVKDMEFTALSTYTGLTESYYMQPRPTNTIVSALDESEHIYVEEYDAELGIYRGSLID